VEVAVVVLVVGRNRVRINEGELEGVLASRVW
jgi:hypothetical protein